jgi:hypothetical protein
VDFRGKSIGPIFVDFWGKSIGPIFVDVLGKSICPCMFSSGYFPGVRLSFADVSEPSVRSIFKGLMKNIYGIYKYHALLSPFIFIKPLKMDLTEGSETSAKLNLTPGT